MAIAMARQGGLGVVHRNLSIDGPGRPGGPGQAQRIRHDHQPGDHRPRTPRSPNWTSSASRYRVSGLPVVDEGRQAAGHRHQPRHPLRARSRTSRIRLVSDVMTKMPLVTGHGGHQPRGGLAHAGQATRSRSSRWSTTQGRLTGLITVKDFTKAEQYPLATKDDEGRLRVGAAIGFFGDGWERAMTPGRRRRGRARSWTPPTATRQGVLDMIRRLKSDPAAAHVDIIGGQAATREGAQALIDAGADGIKVGVGPGLHLHHPRGGRRRRPADHRHLRVRQGRHPGRRAADRRRRPAVLRRHRQGPGRRRRHRHARLPAGRHATSPRAT